MFEHWDSRLRRLLEVEEEEKEGKDGGGKFSWIMDLHQPFSYPDATSLLAAQVVL